MWDDNDHGRHGGGRGGSRGGGHGGGVGPFGIRFDLGGLDFGRRREGGGGGRQRRMFDGRELRLVLLKLIAEAPRHGYELIRTIEERTDGAYAPSPGVVYPTLSMLDEMALVAEQHSDDSKKRFAITEDGEAYLAKRHEEVAQLFERLDALGERRGRGQGAPVWRAMGNLGVAIQHRLSRGDFSEDTLHDVAALIDEVAQKIERLR